MPNFLTPEQIADFTASTIKKFKRNKITDISLDYTEYVSAMMLDEKKVIEQGGEQISYRVMVSNTGNARNTGMFAEDQTAVKDVLQSANVPWRMQTTNYSYSIYEPAFQSDRETIIKTLMVREHDAMNAMFGLHEENLWSSPTSATDNRPYGIPYWIRKSVATPDGAFNGTSAFGTTTADIDTTTYPNWRNWAGQYSSVTVDDLIRKIKLAIYNTNFQAPHPHPELGYGKADYQLYTTLTVQEPLERVAELRNDRLGSDVAKYMNRVTVGGVPLKYVPYLEANDTTDQPVYGVSWKHFRPFIKSGANMRRHPPEKAPKQHDTYDVHIDHWMNYCCYDRRRQFVISK